MLPTRRARSSFRFDLVFELLLGVAVAAMWEFRDRLTPPSSFWPEPPDSRHRPPDRSSAMVGRIVEVERHSSIVPISCVAGNNPRSPSPVLEISHVLGRDDYSSLTLGLYLE